MKIDAIAFASLLCSRLCHDLLSPVGALSNGLELLAEEDDPEIRQQCLDLLAESTRATTHKLKFFRLAFGAAGGFGDEVSSEEVRAALEGLFAASKRVSIGWLVTDPLLPKPVAKILLNLAMIAGDALVRGGRLDIGAERHADRAEIVVRATGDRLVLDPAIRQALCGDVMAADLTPRLAAAWMVHGMTRATGGALQLSPEGAPHILFGAFLPRAA
jgi:histidine phosphotransferase ChpT